MDYHIPDIGQYRALKSIGLALVQIVLNYKLLQSRCYHTVEEYAGWY